MHSAIGPLVRFFTRNMYNFIEKRISWYEPKTINKNVKKNLNFGVTIAGVSLSLDL